MNWILDIEAFMARRFCGPGWTDAFAAVYVSAQCMMGFAYSVVLPIGIKQVYGRLREVYDLPLHVAPIFVLFAAFIGLCGLSHFYEAVSLWWPAYRVSLLLVLLDALLAYLAAFYLAVLVHSSRAWKIKQ